MSDRAALCLQAQSILCPTHAQHDQLLTYWCLVREHPILVTRIMDAMKTLIETERQRDLAIEDAAHREMEAHSLQKRVATLEDALSDYGCHTSTCVLSRWEQSDPSRGVKYAGTWYATPPPCGCGLSGFLPPSPR